MSPFNSNTPIDLNPKNLILLNSDVSIQTDFLNTNQVFNTPILSQLQVNIDSLNSFNSEITPITPNITSILLNEDLCLTDLCLLFL